MFSETVIYSIVDSSYFFCNRYSSYRR